MIADKIFLSAELSDWRLFDPVSRYLRRYGQLAALALLLTAVAIPAYGWGKKDGMHYGEGLIINVPLPEPEVEQAVEDVAQNTIIRGTKEYNKDEYVTGAVAAISTPVFPAWKDGGKVFYKVRFQALDPRNFKDSGDSGTLAVRYVLKPQGDTNTVLRIDALFVEDNRHTVHKSNGSVESAEYKDIQDHLTAVELVKKETVEAEEAKRERLSKKSSEASADARSDARSDTGNTAGNTNGIANKTAGENPGQNSDSAGVTAAAAPPSPVPQPATYEQSGQSLEERVAELRRQLQRVVKKPGAPLQSAPFHTATTLKSLAPGDEVLIVISTSYWYGVETRDGDHGWVRRDELEQVP